MKLNVGELVKVISCYTSPELKGKIGLFIGINDWGDLQVLIGSKMYRLIANDLEVINESKSNEA